HSDGSGHGVEVGVGHSDGSGHGVAVGHELGSGHVVGVGHSGHGVGVGMGVGHAGHGVGVGGGVGHGVGVAWTSKRVSRNSGRTQPLLAANAKRWPSICSGQPNPAP